MEDWTYGIGLALGVACIGGVLVPWIRLQKLGNGGAALAVIGFLFVGLSIWRDIQIEGAGIKVQVSRMEEQLSEVQLATNVVSEQVITVAENVETTQKQFVALTDELRRIPAIDPAELEEIRQPILEARPIDLERLRVISPRRDMVPQQQPH